MVWLWMSSSARDSPVTGKRITSFLRMIWAGDVPMFKVPMIKISKEIMIGISNGIFKRNFFWNFYSAGWVRSNRWWNECGRLRPFTDGADFFLEKGLLPDGHGIRRAPQELFWYFIDLLRGIWLESDWVLETAFTTVRQGSIKTDICRKGRS